LVLLNLRDNPIVLRSSAVWTHLMSHPLLPIEAEAQQVLDELLSEKLIPFALKVVKISKSPGEYTIHFYGRRIRTVRIALTRGRYFRDLVRSAVLARVTRKLSEPLNWSSNHFLD
jgi:hypothetical protein